MFDAALKALGEIFSPPLRRVLWRTLLLAIILLAAMAAGAQWGIEAIPEFDIAWLDTGIEWLAQLGLVLVLILLLMPVTSLFAGLFLEEVAAAVEEKDYPADPPGTDQPFWRGLWIAIKFTTVLIVLNILALPLYFVPIVNIFVFWVLNGYLLGREYFELVAMRHNEPDAAQALRRKHRFGVMTGGALIAAFASIPVVNLLAPFFATAFMVHIHKRVTRVA